MLPLILPHTEDVCTITIFDPKIPYPLGLVLEIFSSILGHSLSTLLSPPESGAILLPTKQPRHPVYRDLPTYRQ